MKIISMRTWREREQTIATKPSILEACLLVLIFAFVVGFAFSGETQAQAEARLDQVEAAQE